MSIFCRLCGFENHSDVRFCGNCGTRLTMFAVGLPILPTQTDKSLHNNVYPMLKSPGDSARSQDWQAGKGERRNITVLFVDLCAYTNLAEVLDNDTLFDLIQQFIELLSGVVNRYEGMVDKVLGDGLMALFGAPVSY
jgi:hypothetical protein